jgi:RHS repeat-associated protein
MEDYNGNRYYFLKDRQYSVTAITDNAGAIIETYEYSAYGIMTIKDSTGEVLTESGVSNTYGYTGRRWDSESGLWYYRNRMYSATLGRFMQRDPAGYVDGYNLYAYVMNNPLVFLDPEGLTARDTFSIDNISSSEKKWYTDPLGPGAGIAKLELDYLQQKLNNARPDNLVSQVFATAAYTGVTVASGILNSPRAIVDEVVNWVKDPLNPTKIPIFGGVAKNIAKTTSDYIDDPNWVTGSKMAGAYGTGILTALGFSGVKGRLTSNTAQKGLSPFKSKSLKQIEKAFQKHVKSGKLELKYINPITGAKSYMNTESGYSYNLDPGGKFRKKIEGPHVDVNYPNPKPKNVPPKKKYPVSGGF